MFLSTDEQIKYSATVSVNVWLFVDLITATPVQQAVTRRLRFENGINNQMLGC